MLIKGGRNQRSRKREEVKQRKSTRTRDEMMMICLFQPLAVKTELQVVVKNSCVIINIIITICTMLV